MRTWTLRKLPLEGVSPAAALESDHAQRWGDDDSDAGRSPAALFKAEQNVSGTATR